MSVMDKVKKVFTLKIFKPTIYTIIITIGIISSYQVLYNLPIAGLETNKYIIRLRFALNISTALGFIISISYFLGYKYPKKSVKRVIYSFIASNLILLDGIVWIVTYKVEINFDGKVSILFDFTSLMFGVLFLLFFNVLFKSFDIFYILKKES